VGRSELPGCGLFCFSCIEEWIKPGSEVNFYICSSISSRCMNEVQHNDPQRCRFIIRPWKAGSYNFEPVEEGESFNSLNTFCALENRQFSIAKRPLVASHRAHQAPWLIAQQSSSVDAEVGGQVGG
jgi:hypothetical protein